MKEYYSPADFIKLPKYDAHTHYHTFNDLFVRMAKKTNISLLTINTNFHILPIDTQFKIAQFLHERYPQSFNFIGAFDASVFASKTFAEDTIKWIQKCITAGARGIKIWKNMGMTLKNDEGQYIMADDPVFDPVYSFLQKEKIPMLAHLGEPRNCWLPLESMTTCSDRRYFSRNPKYHMYLYPEAPTYEQHIMAQNNILERFPELIFVGAHLGSMECNLEEIAKRLERFPNYYVDISGRFEHILEQTIRNRNKVIDFFETYQNRIIFGLDYFVSPNYGRRWMDIICKCFPHIYFYLIYKFLFGIYKKHWLFFATDKVIKTGKMTDELESPTHIKGLQLKKGIIDRIFYENAVCVYGM